MSNQTSDLQATWAFLEEGVKRIMTRFANISYDEYMSLYTVLYNYCLSSHFPSSMLLSDHGIPRAFELHRTVAGYLDTEAARIYNDMRSVPNDRLVSYYAREWDNYTRGTDYIQRLFCYTERWLKREWIEGRRNAYPINIFAPLNWKAHIFTPLTRNLRLTKAMLRLLREHRKGESVDVSAIKTVLDSFIYLGLNLSHPLNPCLDVYEKYFETPFLQETETYYRRESRSFLANHGVSEYLKKAVEWFRKEDDLGRRHLIIESRKALNTVCEQTLIYDHEAAICELDFRQLIKLDRQEDLEHIYLLLMRLPERLELFCKNFEASVLEAGLSEVSMLIGEAHTNTKGMTVDPKAYVNALMAVYNKHKALVQKEFRNNTRLMECFDKACEDFINCSAVTDKSNSKSAELIARYADLALRKRTKTADEDDVEVALDNVLALVKYLKDKDVFQGLYHNRLAKRLVYGVSASEDDEMTMINKLEVLCGSECAANLRKTITDMKLSHEASASLTEEMRRYCSTRIDYSIQVLATNLCPLDPPTHEFAIPRELLPIYTGFKQYYKDKFAEGRKLTWLWNHSKNELKANYLDQPYVLVTSTYQTAILLQYNHMDKMSLDELFRATSIPKDHLKPVLQILVKGKLLINEEKNQYDLNPSFRSRRIRINFNQPIKLEQKAVETKEVTKVFNQRQTIIQAAIVRIMKARRQLKHQSLIQELIEQLASKFTPEVPDIKKAIDHLLFTEYIGRAVDEKDAYFYIA